VYELCFRKINLEEKKQISWFARTFFAIIYSSTLDWSRVYLPREMRDRRKCCSTNTLYYRRRCGLARKPVSGLFQSRRLVTFEALSNSLQLPCNIVLPPRTLPRNSSLDRPVLDNDIEIDFLAVKDYAERKLVTSTELQKTGESKIKILKDKKLVRKRFLPPRT